MQELFSKTHTDTPKVESFEKNGTPKDKKLKHEKELPLSLTVESFDKNGTPKIDNSPSTSVCGGNKDQVSDLSAPPVAVKSTVSELIGSRVLGSDKTGSTSES